MEPYLEPTGDGSSWGFRPGRGTSHAITQIAQILQRVASTGNNRYKARYNDSLLKLRATMKSQNQPIDPDSEVVTVLKPRPGKRSFKQRIPKTLIADTQRNTINHTKYILEGDIEGCFDNIDHNWLLREVPIPSKYKPLLYNVLKTDIVERNTHNQETDILRKYSNATWIHWRTFKEKLNLPKGAYKSILKAKANLKGVPQGGIISPMLMNWTLDGLSDSARVASVTTPETGEKLINRILEETADLSDKPNKTNLLASTHLIRYADDFVFITQNPDGIERARAGINNFLGERGLKLNGDKTRTIKFSMGNKFDFLGWTFHMLSPDKVNWLTDVPHSISTRLKDRTKLYVYPSSESTKRFRAKIKDCTGMSSVGLKPTEVIRRLNQIIWGWGNYFTPSPNQYYLRASLDHFVFKRCMKWLYKKYGRKSYALMARNLLMSVDNSKWLRSMTVNTIPQVSVKSLRDLSVPEMLQMVKPTNTLKSMSMYINPEPYVKRALKLKAGQTRGDDRAQCIISQKLECAICKKPLMDFNDLASLSIKGEIITTMDSNREGDNLNGSLLTDYLGETWYKGIQTDHLVPKFLMKDTGGFGITESLTNKVAVHKRCHKAKTRVDQRFLIKPWRSLKISQGSGSIATQKLLEDKVLLNRYLDELRLLYSNDYMKRVHLILKSIKKKGSENSTSPTSQLK